MIKRVLVLLMPAILLPVWGVAQVVYGKVTDRETGSPVNGVVVIVDGGEQNSVTSDEGTFRFESLEPGTYNIVIQHIQYEPVYREIVLSSARDFRMDISLVRSFVELPEATVTSTGFTRENALYTISPEEITRYPGTFFDPARFALSFPGVQVVNDQSNELVINGMAPGLMKWRLEGLEIVNPNHLANAGTISDRPTSTGGGVNMLSNLVVDNSSLLTGITPGYGNATSGIMDMYFRNGNTTDYQHSIQVGLLGLEAMTEGPLKKGGKSSYLVNGRYSTVGLLSAIGVDFGDEKIAFGDISANVNFNLSERSKLKVFGLFGANSNKFDAKNPNEWEEDKDRRNIDFSSRTYVAGATFSQSIGSLNLLSASIAYSFNSYDRYEELTDTQGAISPFASDTAERGKLSFDLNYSTVLNGQWNLVVGFGGILDDYDGLSAYETTGEVYFNNSSNSNYRPYISARGAISKSIGITAGIGYSYYENSESWNFEPELELSFQPDERKKLTLGYHLSSQALNEEMFIQAVSTFPPGDTSDNTMLNPIRAHHVYTSYQVVLGGGIFRLDARFVSLFNVLADARERSYSPLNLNPYPAYRALINEGKGDIVSLAIGYRKNFSNNWFASGNIAFISSKYEDVDGNRRRTTYDLGYVAYAASGKEWIKKNDKGLRTWGLNGGLVVNGGMREPTISVAASEAMMRTAYIDGTQGENRLSDYFRVDVRAYWRIDKAKNSSTISLDIQNLLGKENAYFTTYDLLNRDFAEGTQLSLIPVLNWRLDF